MFFPDVHGPYKTKKGKGGGEGERERERHFYCFLILVIWLMVRYSSDKLVDVLNHFTPHHLHVEMIFILFVQLLSFAGGFLFLFEKKTFLKANSSCEVCT